LPFMSLYLESLLYSSLVAYARHNDVLAFPRLKPR
jgi:hypothetical protein